MYLFSKYFSPDHVLGAKILTWWTPQLGETTGQVFLPVFSFSAFTKPLR